MQERIEQRVQHGRGDQREVLVAVLAELLGVDPETRDPIRINVAFAARAPDDQRIAAVLTQGDEELVTLAVAVVAHACAAGLISPDTKPDAEGRVLLALTTGLGGQVALYGASPAAARATLHYYLQRVAPAAGDLLAGSSTPSG